MNNVEAIEVLIHECPKSPRKPYGAIKKAAFLMAIDALSDKRKKDIENAVIDRVLEIINAEHDSVTNRMNIDEEYVSVYTVIKEIRAALLALKGGEQE